jgi:hypothetical protein
MCTWPDRVRRGLARDFGLWTLACDVRDTRYVNEELVRRNRRWHRFVTDRAAAGREPRVCFDERIEVRCTPAAAFDLLANVDRYAAGPD